MPFLIPNDHVALICPASTCRELNHPEMTQAYLYQQYQLHSVFKEDTTQKTSPQRRTEILLDFLLNDSIKLIAALRGGEGSADIIPYLHHHAKDIQGLAPKILLGNSDITALLVYFNQYFHWPVIHGASPLQFVLSQVDKETEKSTMDLLFGNTTAVPLTHLIPLNDFARKEQSITGELTGGNLSVLDISIQDIWEINTQNKILFLEDCAEKAHKVIRTLKYFHRIGLFESAQAVILGDFTCWPIGCTEEEQDNNRLAILKSLAYFASLLSIPVFYSQAFGHGITNLPLVYGKPYQLQMGELGALTQLC